MGISKFQKYYRGTKAVIPVHSLFFFHTNLKRALILTLFLLSIFSPFPFFQHVIFVLNHFSAHEICRQLKRGLRSDRGENEESNRKQGTYRPQRRGNGGRRKCSFLVQFHGEKEEEGVKKAPWKKIDLHFRIWNGDGKVKAIILCFWPFILAYAERVRKLDLWINDGWGRSSGFKRSIYDVLPRKHTEYRT